MKKERKSSWKQESAGGFKLNLEGMPLDGNGKNALKSTQFSSKKKKDVENSKPKPWPKNPRKSQL